MRIGWLGGHTDDARGGLEVRKSSFALFFAPFFNNFEYFVFVSDVHCTHHKRRQESYRDALDSSTHVIEVPFTDVMITILAARDASTSSFAIAFLQASPPPAFVPFYLN